MCCAGGLMRSERARSQLWQRGWSEGPTQGYRSPCAAAGSSTPRSISGPGPYACCGCDVFPIAAAAIRHRLELDILLRHCFRTGALAAPTAVARLLQRGSARGCSVKRPYSVGSSRPGRGNLPQYPDSREPRNRSCCSCCCCGLGKFVAVAGIVQRPGCFRDGRSNAFQHPGHAVTLAEIITHQRGLMELLAVQPASGVHLGCSRGV